MTDLNFGKCCKIESGDRCGCQCYRANTSDNTTCDVCFHDVGFHERVETAAPSSLLNQVISGQALEDSIASELSQTFSHRNFANSSTKTRRGSYRTFDPATAANFNLSQSYNRRNRRAEAVKEILVQTILLPDFGQSLRSPVSSQPKYQKMCDAGYIKDITFKESDNVLQKIEETFPILSGKEWALRQSSAKGYTDEYNTNGMEITYSMIKRLLVNKNKLYISPKYETLPLPTAENQIGSTPINPISIDDSIPSSTSTFSLVSSTPSAFQPIPTASTFSSSSSTFPLTTPLFNPLSSFTNYTQVDNIESGSASNSTIRSDRSFTNLLMEPSASPKFIRDNIDNFIQQMVIQLQLDHKTSGMEVLTINNTIDVANEIFQWVENIDNAQLLKKPMVSVMTERVVDAGGVFMHVTQQFWDQIKDYEISFFNFNDDLFIISSNPILLTSKKLVSLGKILFWCLIHNGAWPHWLHKFHFQYMFDLEINYIDVLKEINPHIYEIIKSIRNFREELKPGKITGLEEWGVTYNLQEIDLITLAKEKKEDLVNFIAQHEILNARKAHLNELKDGFNIFNLIKIVKENAFNITWKDFEFKLYDVVITEEDLLNQFDNITNVKRLEGKSKREILYTKFLDFLKNLKFPTERQNVLKFICGKIAIPLPSNQKIQINWKDEGNKEHPFLRIPNAKTCLKAIWLCENYDDDEMDMFEKDLEEAFIHGVNTGFMD